MSTSSGQLIILVGPAGSGKTTLAHRLISEEPTRRGFSVSHTTRPIRANEVDGRDYHFVDRQRFEALIDEDAFVEWATVHGNYYGTSRQEVLRHVSAGSDLFFDIDIQGAVNLYQQFPEPSRLVFIVPPTWPVLVARLTSRGTETEQTIRRRLQTARTELQGLLASDLPWQVVINDALEVATTDLEAALVGKEPSGHRGLLEAMYQAAKDDPRTGA